MWTKSSNENLYSESQVSGGQGALAAKIVVDRALTRTCCGELIESQLGRSP